MAVWDDKPHHLHGVKSLTIFNQEFGMFRLWPWNRLETLRGLAHPWQPKPFGFGRSLFGTASTGHCRPTPTEFAAGCAPCERVSRALGLSCFRRVQSGSAGAVATARGGDSMP